jgi:hypothetical protein
MGWLDRLVARDQRLAATKYAGRESASARATRKRREGRRRQIGKAAAQGERWEQQDRRRFS